MPTPSLLIVPARFKTGKLYSQIPTSGAGDFTVTRNTAARRFDSAGLVASVASGIPRLDYYTSGGVTGCPALLVEPAATNTALQSAGFELSGTWVPTNISVTTGTTSAFTAPDGSTDADLLADNSTNGRHRVQQNLLSFTSGTTYTFSVFVKKNSSNRFLLINANTAFNSVAVLSLDTLAITNISGSGASVENYGNGWYRFSIRGTASATTAGGTVFVQMQDAATDTTYIGNGSSFYLWGAQLETGSVATSYIPTTTGTATRNADVINVTGAVSGCIGQTEGTIYAEVDSRNQQTGRIVSFQIAGTAVSGQVRIDTVGASLRCRLVNASGTDIYNQTIAPAMSVGINKMAFAFNSAASGLVVALNGSIVDARTASASTVHNATQLTIGAQDSIAGFGSFFNDRIRAVALYTTRLTNAQLAALTTL